RLQLRAYDQCEMLTINPLFGQLAVSPSTHIKMPATMRSIPQRYGRVKKKSERLIRWFAAEASPAEAFPDAPKRSIPATKFPLDRAVCKERDLVKTQSSSAASLHFAGRAHRTFLGTTTDAGTAQSRDNCPTLAVGVRIEKSSRL
ncbi:hypothetical protein, partial [Mesorhizobium escarrei]|uniref:hypothetical protein n=1 Tax=Mesorhizobium escarrei TaxID=666018 RepID=UPI0020A7C274